jgi:hypothetical protein
MAQSLYIGWFRANPTVPWRQIVQGATYNEALDRLLTAVGAGDCLVLPAGRDPGAARATAADSEDPGQAGAIGMRLKRPGASQRAF